MKHPLPASLLIVILFVLAQIIGLITLSAYMQKDASGVISFREIMVGGVELERPQTTGSQTVVMITVAVILGTLLMFFLMWLNWPWIWRLWFALAITGCLAIAFAGFIPGVSAFWLALFLGVWRTLRPNIIVHNLTEVFLYGGLAVLFVPLLNLASASVLLILISIYDAYAVWKSQHMITLAKFQTRAQIFAGMMIPYGKMPTERAPRKQGKGAKGRAAILGGGDVGFPLFFAGTVFVEYGPAVAWVTLGTTLALVYLMFFGKKDRFYPAMPYLSAGCFVGLGVVILNL